MLPGIYSFLRISCFDGRCVGESEVRGVGCPELQILFEDDMGMEQGVIIF